MYESLRKTAATKRMYLCRLIIHWYRIILASQRSFIITKLLPTSYCNFRCSQALIRQNSTWNTFWWKLQTIWTLELRTFFTLHDISRQNLHSNTSQQSTKYLVQPSLTKIKWHKLISPVLTWNWKVTSIFNRNRQGRRNNQNRKLDILIR